MLRGELAHRVLEDTLRALSDGGAAHARAPRRGPRAAARGARRARRRRAHLAQPRAPARGAAPAGGRPAALRRARRPRAARPSRPREFELRFGGPEDPLGPAELAGGELRLQGRIDRIDVSADGGEAIVYDYKGKGAPPQARWLEDAQASRSGSTCSRCRSCSTSKPVGGLYQPLGRDDDGRPRGLLLDGRRPRPHERVDSDRLAPRTFEALLQEVLDAALQAVRGIRSGALVPRPDVVRLPRRLRAPDDLPLRGGARASTARRSPPSRPRRSPAARATLMLSANAGSGKTSVLVERFVRLGRRRTTCAPTRSWRSRSPRRRRASCARACARASLELGDRERGARRRGRVDHDLPRLLRADPARARGRRRPRPRLRRARSGRRRAPPSAQAFDAALADFLAGAARRRARPRRRPTRSTGCSGWSSRRTTSCARAGRRGPRCRRRGAADLDAARAELERACAAFAAELAGGGRRRGRRRARARRSRVCRAALDAGAPAHPKGAKVGAQRRTRCKTPAADAYRAALRGLRRARSPIGARVPALALVDELLGRYADAYAAAKRARAGVDFDDLELLARDLLRRRRPASPPATASASSASWSTSSRTRTPLQLELLELLARDNVFTVGDELQSIYGFRHADVEVFRARRERLEATGRTATLATNFRSRPEILRALDAALRPAARATGSTCARAATTPPAPEPVVELLLTDADAWNGGAPGALGLGLPAAAPVKQAEARARGRSASPRWCTTRACAPRDIVVLLRAATDMGLYERAMEPPGCRRWRPAAAAGGGASRSSTSAAYLAALANPRDEEALLGLLASPLVGAVLRRAGAARRSAARERRARRSGRRVHDDALTLAPDATTAAPGRLPRVVRAASASARPRLRARRGPRSASSTARATTCTCSRCRGGARRLANVHKLQRLAAAFEARRGRDVRGFIDLATAELEAEAREPDAPVDLGGLDAVRLMTIHAAKGLEFPIVVVADLGRRGATTARRTCSSRAAASACGSSAIDGAPAKTLDWEAIADERRAADEAEERRVMHVADDAGRGAPDPQRRGRRRQVARRAAARPSRRCAGSARGCSGPRASLSLDAPERARWPRPPGRLRARRVAQRARRRARRAAPRRRPVPRRRRGGATLGRLALERRLRPPEPPPRRSTRRRRARGAAAPRARRRPRR